MSLSVLLVSNDLATTPTTFPGLFTLYTTLFALMVLYYLLLSPNFRALTIGGPLQKLLKMALGEDQQLKISQWRSADRHLLGAPARGSSSEWS